jgi:predicted transcriptional regulator
MLDPDAVITAIEKGEGGATVPEIMQATKSKRHAVQEVLDKLMGQGIVTREKRLQRNWRGQNCTSTHGPPRLYFYQMS